MPDRGIVFGVLFVAMISFVVMLVEIFLPVSKKIEMNIDCRSAMLKMELEGGLSDTERHRLETRMSGQGLTNVNIGGTSWAKQGGELKLRVDADYVYSRFSSIFSRENVTLHLVYDRTSIARKVLN